MIFKVFQKGKLLQEKKTVVVRDRGDKTNERFEKNGYKYLGQVEARTKKLVILKLTKEKK